MTMDTNIQYLIRVFGEYSDGYHYEIGLDGDGMVELRYKEPERPEVDASFTVAPSDLPAFIKALSQFAEMSGFTGEEE